MPAIAFDGAERGGGHSPARRWRRGRRWRPRWTVRLRLTLLYGGLFLIAGALLLGITYELVAGSVSGRTAVFLHSAQGVATGAPALGRVKGAELYFSTRPGFKPPRGAKAALGNDPAAQLPPPLRGLANRLRVQAQVTVNAQQQTELDALLTRSGMALGIMAFVSIALGWLMAGRALRPVRTMNVRARGISERNLHERLALGGPNDELRELGETFDGLLGRLEMAFESQRRFVANASHELRTPITLERTLVEVALANPDATVASLRETCERVLAAGEQQERLIEALLTLARSQRGLESRHEVDLAALVGEAVRGVSGRGVRIESRLEQASTMGDQALLERLAGNLIENAVLHNRPDGSVTVWTGLRAGRPTLEVANTGPVLTAEQVPQLVEPFRRLNGNRAAPSARRDSPGAGERAGIRDPHGQPGLGIGLSIVDAIATAHGARLRVEPRSEGGLRVEVRFEARSVDLAPIYTETQDVSALGRVGDPGRAY